jgi:NADH-quinone oxidoreductase subunit K
VLTVAAAEVVIGLAIIVAIFRTRETIDVDTVNTMKG